MAPMKRIGFLSFGHWSASPYSQVRTASDALLQTIELAVRSESRRAIRVSSHFPFDRVNQRLVFDREAARGFRLDVEAGESVRWAPGQERTVRLVRFGGAGGER